MNCTIWRPWVDHTIQLLKDNDAEHMVSENYGLMARWERARVLLVMHAVDGSGTAIDNQYWMARVTAPRLASLVALRPCV